jgi:hypothetical protein
MVAVTSSMMTDADHDAAARELRIRFVEGDRYTYLGVPPASYQALLAAPSKGRSFHLHILDRFAYRRG